MCTFVPGEAIAVGPINILREVGDGLPGVQSTVRPLISPVGDFPHDSELARMGTLTIKTDPGLELYAVSRISARLAAAIEKGEAAVDLNHILPLGAATEPLRLPLRLTPYAEGEAAGIRRVLGDAFAAARTSMRIAVLDSGLAPEYVANRKVRYLDYADGGRLRLQSPLSDPLGHGTRVVAILDRILPNEVELSVGRLPVALGSLTALNVAHALGDIVARERPDVVNLSVTMRSDWFVCPACEQLVSAPTFLSTFLPLIIRLSGRTTERTVTVMAAGNTGQPPNSQWLTEDLDTLLFAIAENHRGEPARYSSVPKGPRADVFSARAFGGDDDGEPAFQGVFTDGTHGTSFAAPFVSAVALFAKNFRAPTPDASKGIGEFTRQLIKVARSGLSLRMEPAKGK